jgi:valyl-tRNA synthetase
VWYPLDAAGHVDYAHPIAASEARLPIDPSTDAPPGYRDDQRGKPGGFVGDPDVMDTWATSSLTPQIVCGWERDPELFAKTFPMDLRPRVHDIIRVAVRHRAGRFISSTTRCHGRTRRSGCVLDPDRKKMPKSRATS